MGRPRKSTIARVVATVAALAALAGCGGDDGGDGGGDPFAPSGPDGPATVWAVGDGATGSEESRRVAETIAAGRPDRFLYLGDVYEHGTREEFARNYEAVYGRFDEIAVPTPGNHEWDRREEGYRPYWREARGEDVPDYYAFDIAGWEVLALNTMVDHGPESEQVSWLRRELSEPGTCRLAIWHHPRYSGGPHGDIGSTESLWGELEGHGVLVLGGNDHSMQRFRPDRGITQLVSGAGGRRLYENNEERPDLVFSDDDDFGALRVELQPGRARFAFVRAGGKVLHEGETACRPLAG